MSDSSIPLTVEEIYSDSPLDDATIDTILNQSQHPRPATMLYDKLDALGLKRSHRLLDVGCRDARHTCAVVQRFNCTAVAIDPVADHLDRAVKVVAEHNLNGSIRISKGKIEAIPTRSTEFDYIWCRDVLNHVADLRKGLIECARVLRPRGKMLVYQTFATDLLEPAEAVRLYPPLAIIAANMSPHYFEEVAKRAGFEILEKDLISSEWREAWEEDGTTTTSQQLLRLARLRRRRDDYIKLLGRTLYEVELANSYWGVYQMLGKLCPIVYTLIKPQQ